MAHVLFSSLPEDLGLYDKPMARNAQIWTHDFRLLLDGPRANRAALRRAAAMLREGGLFGYRFQYPAMRVGQYEIYWHRPLVAYLSPRTAQPEVLSDAPLGYLTAYRAGRPNPAKAIELWPRLLARRPHVAAIESFLATPEHHQHRIARTTPANCWRPGNCWASSRCRAVLPGAVATSPTNNARRLARPLGKRRQQAGGRPRLAAELRRRIDNAEAGPHHAALPGIHLSSHRPRDRLRWPTGERSPGWPTASTSTRTTPTASAIPLRRRCCGISTATWKPWATTCWLTISGLIEKAGMADQRGRRRSSLPLADRFWLSLAGGWLDNQQGKTEERDLMVVIPGRDRRRAMLWPITTTRPIWRTATTRPGVATEPGWPRPAPTTIIRPPPP